MSDDKQSLPERALEMLELHQWDAGTFGGECPECSRDHKRGHSPDCALRALLDEYAERERRWKPSARDYPDDFDHENGQYMSNCRECGEQFMGHKRRYVCAVCAAPPAKLTAAEGIDAQHLQRQREWSERTFGPGQRLGVIDHIRKELREIEAAPDDVEEWADVVILALDGAWRTGASPDEIIAAVKAKQAKNEARDWPDWRTVPSGEAIEHVRGAAPAAEAEETPSESQEGMES